MAKKKTELLPCPFCGENKAEVVYYENMHFMYVRCECSVHGAARATEAEAIEAWNRRIK
jgi:Lar family restriction alleviation protein